MSFPFFMPKKFLRDVSAVMAAVALVMLAPAQGRAGVFEDALTAALEKSNDLKRARFNLRANQESLPQAKAGKEFSVSISAGSGAVDRKVYGVFEGSAFSPDREVDDALSLNVSKTIYDGGSTKISVDTAKIYIAIEEISFRDQVASILNQAIDTYIAVVIAREKLRVQEVNAARTSQVLQETQSRERLGSATAADLATAQAQHAGTNSELTQARNALADAEDQYRKMMGIDPPGLMELPPAPVSRIPKSMAEMEREFLANNPGLRSSKLNEQAERRTLDQLATRYRPIIGFTVSATKSGTNPEGAEPRTESDSGNVSARIDLTIPLYVPPSERASARADILRHRATLLSLAEETENARIDARASYRNYMRTRENFDAAQAAHEAEKIRSREIGIAEKNGSATRQDVLAAEAALMQARVSMLEAQGALVTEGYNLLQRLGALDPLGMGITTNAAKPDTSVIRFPVKLRPFPVYRHPDE